MLSEALWGLAAAGGTAMVGAVATDAWRSVRQRFAGQAERRGTARERVESRAASGRLRRASADTAGARAAEHEAGHGWRSWRSCSQQNIARDGGTQHITLNGDINVGGESRGSR
ncbi:hypothetical protein JCM4814A_83960 [Streptomyces phaeofaciens JCM 4814]|uniref:Uncharacterized protein n=1 Tax=Streptomyces phaeofaciens TaxID=68254 RepID=A0A918HQ04_9ACTN|nr:hypothetical protein [Streptomyces phaeofaciens]GGT83407.1 hypothetical protein GCM10010226_72590 [Streptomyces phaeofaciens]